MNSVRKLTLNIFLFVLFGCSSTRILSEDLCYAIESGGKRVCLSGTIDAELKSIMKEINSNSEVKKYEFFPGPEDCDIKVTLLAKDEIITAISLVKIWDHKGKSCYLGLEEKLLKQYETKSKSIGVKSFLVSDFPGAEIIFSRARIYFQLNPSSHDAKFLDLNQD